MVVFCNCSEASETEKESRHVTAVCDIYYCCEVWRTRQLQDAATAVRIWAKRRIQSPQKVSWQVWLDGPTHVHM